jgi:hypothetical protein
MNHMAKNRRSASRAMAAAVVAGYAIVASASTQIPVDRTILQMGAYADLGYIVFAPAVPNLEGCSYTNGDQLAIVWAASPDSKTMYSTALAAHLAGQRVGFGVSGCHSGGLPIAYRVDVKP